MPTPIDPKRLPRLKKALANFADDDWASQRQLAELFGVAPSRFVTLIKTRFPEFPAAERRDDKTHWYPAKAAAKAMIAYMENTSRAKLAQARRHSEIMGRTVADVAKEPEEAPAQQPLSASELDRLASAQTKIWKLRKDQGLYTLTSEVQRISRGVNAMITREVMNLVNEIDPNGEMTPVQRQAINRKCRDMVLKMHDIMGRFLEEDDDAGRARGAIVARAGAAGDPVGASLRRPARGMGGAA